MGLGQRMRLSIQNTVGGQVSWVELNQSLGANETFQTNPIDINGSQYTATVGANPTAFAGLVTNVPTTVYYDTSDDAITWTQVDSVASSISGFFHVANLTEPYSAHPYGRFRVVNGGTTSGNTYLSVGLKAP
jgi:hypothetical protein